MTQTDINPVAKAAARIGFVVPEGHEQQYHALLSKTDAACRAVLAVEDYKPHQDLDRWPRRDVHLPTADENTLRAWAWRADVGHRAGDDEAENTLLHGKTVVLKDTICLAGVPLLLGTNAFQGYIPDLDATVVTRVLEAGGNILGKAGCENFSHGATSSSSPYGPVDNPYATGFTCGGSSSGCGGLVGSGVADMAIGGDQGGSIRIPAAFCGIIGLKPTFGLVSYTGVVSSEAASDHVGPMARSILDTAALLQATAGYDGIDDRQLGAPSFDDVPDYVKAVHEGRQQGIKRMRIGVLKEAWDQPDLSQNVRTAFQDAIDRLKCLGAEVVEVSIPLQSLASSLLHVVNKFGSGGTRLGRQVGRRGHYINPYWDQLLPWNQDKYGKAKYFVTGTAMSSEHGWTNYPTAYGRAMNLSRRLRDEYDAALDQVDAIITPTVPQPARRHIRLDAGPLEWAQQGPGSTAFTCAFNLTGHPALSIPMGFVPCMTEDIRDEADKNIRLPVGLQIVGKRWDEATLLKIGDAFERDVDWKTLVFA